MRWTDDVAGGGEAHPSVIGCSWYIKLCNIVFWGSVLGSDNWNVAYGDMSSEVSEKETTYSSFRLFSVNDMIFPKLNSYLEFSPHFATLLCEWLHNNVLFELQHFVDYPIVLLQHHYVLDMKLNFLNILT